MEGSLFKIMRKLVIKYQKSFKKILSSIFRKRIGWQKKIMKVFKFLYLLFCFPIEVLGDLLFFWKRVFSKKIIKPKKILIVKIDQFGDVLFSTFLIPLIKKEFPEIEIHYLINPKTETLLKKNPNINKIYFWQDPFLYFILGRKEEKKKISFFKILKKNYQILKLLRKEKYDIIINTRAFAPSSNLFFKLMKPKYLIAFNASEQSFLADCWADYDFYEEEWKNYLKLIQPFLELKEIFFSSHFFNFDDEGLKERFSEEKDKLAIISPISFDKERLWKIDYWQKTIEDLIEQNYDVVLTGLKSQEKYLLEITQSLNFGRVKIFTNLTIPQLASLTRISTLVICIDSFITHLAIALKKPVICLINLDIYFLKGFSQYEKFIDTKSMIPLIDRVKVISTNSDAEDVIKIINTL